MAKILTQLPMTSQSIIVLGTRLIRRLLPGLVAITAVAGSIAFTSGCAPATNCGQIAFIPQSDSGVGEITAYGAACSTARALAVKSRPDPATFSAYAFNCKGTHYLDGLAHTGYVCFGPSGKVVSFNLYY